MLRGEREKLISMEDELHRRVIGQDEAIVAISDAIRRSRAGLSDPDRPYGSFMFLGPTGVGKTELCKALAGFLFDSADSLIRIVPGVLLRHPIVPWDPLLYCTCSSLVPYYPVLY